MSGPNARYFSIPRFACADQAPDALAVALAVFDASIVASSVTGVPSGVTWFGAVATTSNSTLVPAAIASCRSTVHVAVPASNPNELTAGCDAGIENVDGAEAGHETTESRHSGASTAAHCAWMRKRIGAPLGCGEPSMRETVICHVGAAAALDGNTATNMAHASGTAKIRKARMADLSASGRTP